MRIRIKFRKNGVLRFIGHLDVMRYFQKAMRRANIDIKYSEGFSPHQIMSFAAPLGVGITSDGEYFDIEVHSTASTEASIAALNAVMAEGMEITGYVGLEQNAKKAMTAVAAADYLVYFKEREEFSQGQIAAMIREYYTNRDSILITKKTKKSEREMDVKPLIYQFLPFADPQEVAAGALQNEWTDPITSGQNGKNSRTETNGQYGGSTCIQSAEEILAEPASFAPGPASNPCRGLSGGLLYPAEPIGSFATAHGRRGFFLQLCAGSTDNVKPELVLQDMYQFFGKPYEPFQMQIHRLEVYEKAGEDLRPLIEAGSPIPSTCHEKKDSLYNDTV